MREKERKRRERKGGRVRGPLEDGTGEKWNLFSIQHIQNNRLKIALGLLRFLHQCTLILRK